MFSKEEARELNRVFWTGFQKYMSSNRSSNGRKISWINYPSEVDSKGARVCFDIQTKDEEIRALLYEQMTELKMVMELITDERACWYENYYYLNKQNISRISWENESLNFYNNEQRGAIYQFLKERLIKFDLFYQEYKEILISLVH
jgi:CRISPR/Cas system type I-B associated protein Csh2 (Cas7 group RAMP superfamily)